MYSTDILYNKIVFSNLLSLSQAESEPSKFVALSGRDIPINFGFAGRDGIRQRSPPNVTFADKGQRRRRNQRSVSARELAARPPWRDVTVTRSTPRRQECLVANITSTKDSPGELSGQVKNLPISGFQSADQKTVEEAPKVKTYPASIEAGENPRPSQNTAVTDQVTPNRDEANASSTEREKRHTPPALVSTTPSFLIGIAPPPSLDEYRRKRPVSRTDESYSVEPTPSFISCSASEKDFPQTLARQKNSAGTSPPMRRKTSAVKDAGSTRSENGLSGLSRSPAWDRRRKNLLSSLNIGDRSSLTSRGNHFRTSAKLDSSTAKSICQRTSESRRDPSAMAKHAGTSTPVGRLKRSPVTPNVRKGSRSKDLTAKNLQREKDPVESDKRNRDRPANAANRHRPVDLSFTPTPSGESKCIKSKKQTTESVPEFPRMRYRVSRKYQAGDFSGRSQFAERIYSVSKQTKEADEVASVPLVHSTYRSDEISEALSDGSVKQPVSFFISCPRSSQNQTASRIPRPQTSSVSIPVKSHSYVVCASPAGTPRPSTAGAEQPSAAVERRSTNTSPSWVSADLPLPISHDSLSDHVESSASEPQTCNDSADPRRFESQNSPTLNCVESYRSRLEDVVVSSESKPAPENLNQLPPSVSALSAATISNFSTHDPAAVATNETIEERSTSTCQIKVSALPHKPLELMVKNLNEPADDAGLNALPTSTIENSTTHDTYIASNNNEEESMSRTTEFTAAHVPQKLSEQAVELLEVALVNYSSTLPAEPDSLTIELGSSQRQYGSNQPSSGTFLNWTTLKPTGAADTVEVHSPSTTQCTALTTATVPQAPTEQYTQSVQTALCYSSTLSVEPNLERLPIELFSDQILYSSNTNQSPNDDAATLDAISTCKISKLSTREATVATESFEEHSISISECTVIETASEPQAQSPRSLQPALSSSVLPAEPNLKRLAVTKSDRDQVQFGPSTGPIQYYDAVDRSSTAELLPIFAESDPECPVFAEVAKLENDALETSTARHTPRTETSKECSRGKSATTVDIVSSDAGLDVRQRSFDEVTVEVAGIAWSRAQREEFRHPEVARLCPSTCEAVVLRTSPPPNVRSVDHVVPSGRAQFPSWLLATAETRRDVVNSSDLSINVVYSRLDRAIQPVDEPFQLTPPNLSSWINNEHAERITETSTLNNYSFAKRYLEQLADDLTATDRPRKRSASLPPVSKQYENRQPENRHQLEDVLITDESQEPEKVEEEQKERGRHKANEQGRRRTISFQSTSAPEVKFKKNQIDLDSKSQPRLKSPRSDLGSAVVQKHESESKRSDNDKLPVAAVTRMKQDGDKELPVLAERNKRSGGGDEHRWQWSEDIKVDVDQPSQLSSGES